jgi:HEAT repeat protein
MKNRLHLLLITLGLTLQGFAADYPQVVRDSIPGLSDAAPAKRTQARNDLAARVAEASAPGKESDRTALSRALAAGASDASAPQPARVWFVRMLEQIGHAESAPDLARLLNDPDAELRDCARRALEINPDALAGKCLVDALKNATDPRWKSAVIHSLGERREAAATSLIAQSLQSPATREAAARALGRIAGRDAVQSLWSVFPDPAVSPALLDAANKLAARNDTPAATAIFERLYREDSATPVRIAALDGLASIDPAKAQPLVEEAISQKDARLQNAAIQAAAAHPAILSSLIPAMDRMAASAKVAMLGVIPAGKCAEAVKLVSDSETEVRIAALNALGRIGTPAAVPVLLTAAVSGSTAEQNAATEALNTLVGADTKAGLESAAAAGDSQKRAIALLAMAAHSYPSAVPMAVEWSTVSKDPVLHKAGLKALRKIGGDSEIEPLARAATSTRAEDVFAVLPMVAERVVNKPAAAQRLISLARGDEDCLASLGDTLAVLGGPDALAAMVKLGGSTKAEIQETALQALSQWQDFGAAQALLDIAGKPGCSPAMADNALRGVVNLIKNSEQEAAGSRADMALAAWKLADNPPRKKLVLSALAAAPSVKSVSILKPLLTDAEVKNEAAAAAVAVARAISRTDRKEAIDLATALRDAAVSPEYTAAVRRLLGER